MDSARHLASGQSRIAGAAIPPEYDHAAYLRRNPDLRGFEPTRAQSHYLHHGMAEGRVCGPIDGRGAFCALVPGDAELLEIGPFCTPSFTRATHDVRYLDAFDTAGLREVARALDWADPARVPEIDFVWRGEPYAALTGRRFDVVFSSHNFEHQPCLVAHLRDVAAVLRPGGRLLMVIPDKRYCFDHWFPESSIADAMDAHLTARTRHTPKSLIEHRLLLTHNDAERHWNNDHGPDPRLRALDAAEVARTTSAIHGLAADAYQDAHAWQFTPPSFRRLMTLLGAIGLHPFSLARVYPTLRPSNEFFAILTL